MYIWHGSVAHAEKMIAIGLDGELAHICIGDSLTALETAMDLRRAGMVGIEDSPNGPVIKRTWRGSETIKAHTGEED